MYAKKEKTPQVPAPNSLQMLEKKKRMRIYRYQAGEVWQGQAPYGNSPTQGNKFSLTQSPGRQMRNLSLLCKL